MTKRKRKRKLNYQSSLIQTKRNPRNAKRIGNQQEAAKREEWKKDYHKHKNAEVNLCINSCDLYMSLRVSLNNNLPRIPVRYTGGMATPSEHDTSCNIRSY